MADTENRCQVLFVMTNLNDKLDSTLVNDSCQLTKFMQRRKFASSACKAVSREKFSKTSMADRLLINKERVQNGYFSRCTRQCLHANAAEPGDPIGSAFGFEKVFGHAGKQHTRLVAANAISYNWQFGYAGQHDGLVTQLNVQLTVVPGGEHRLDKDYVGKLLDRWLKQ